MKQKRHSANVKYVREMLTLSRKEVRKISGLPAPLIRKIAAGKVKTISHETFNKFRNAYAKTVYNTLVSHNVPVREARKRKYGLTFELVRQATKQTDYGKPLELALNSLENFHAVIEKITRTEPPEDVDELIEEEETEYDMELTQEKAEYLKYAKIICENNNFYKHWIDEGKRFFHSNKPVRTPEDVENLMLQIMAYLNRTPEGWDMYVTELRQNKEQWVPMKYVRIKKKYVRVPVPETDPKYVDWTRRTKRGEIVKV